MTSKAYHITARYTIWYFNAPSSKQHLLINFMMIVKAQNIGKVQNVGKAYNKGKVQNVNNYQLMSYQHHP